MRLVSCIFDDYFPFDKFSFVDSCATTNSPEDLREGDILLLWGGEDISPELYHRPISLQSGASLYPSRRDRIEWAMMTKAKTLGIPILGICRGAQILCAFAGGYLMQHVHGHLGDHWINTYDGKCLLVNSYHHQMMVPRSPITNEPVVHEIIAEVPLEELRSNIYIDGNKQVDHNQEPEFIFFNEINGFAVQWHPEYLERDIPSTKYIEEFMSKHLETVNAY
jgi:putative glutamine amidotransferase